MKEDLILSELVTNEPFLRAVLPFLKVEYFTTPSYKEMFNTIKDFYLKYDAPPSKAALIVEFDEKNLTDTVYTQSLEIIENIEKRDNDYKWLIDATEKFCKDRAIYNAVHESILLLDDKSGKGNRNQIPFLLQEALGISFDSHIGHDYIEDADSRYEFYHRKAHKFPFRHELLNDITKGGVESKTLNMILGGVHVGKTLIMCSLAADYLEQGFNVLYVTLEMAEEKISQRIDANLLNCPISDLEFLTKEMYDNKIAKIKSRTTGKLIVKEFPTSSANVTHLKALLNELKIKKKFVPQIIFVDYLNLMSSARYKFTGSTYTFVKAISEELRGLSVETGTAIWSATQTTREGFSSSDLGMDDTSESFGLPATADFFLAAINTEELQARNQLLIKQLKNRYDDLNRKPRFVVGIDRGKMRIFETEEFAQDDLVDDKPVMDKTDFGHRLFDEV